MPIAHKQLQYSVLCIHNCIFEYTVLCSAQFTSFFKMSRLMKTTQLAVPHRQDFSHTTNSSHQSTGKACTHLVFKIR